MLCRGHNSFAFIEQDSGFYSWLLGQLLLEWQPFFGSATAHFRAQQTLPGQENAELSKKIDRNCKSFLISTLANSAAHSAKVSHRVYTWPIVLSSYFLVEDAGCSSCAAPELCWAGRQDFRLFATHIRRLIAHISLCRRARE